MIQKSEKKHWDDFWAASSDLKDVYANDGRIIENLKLVLDVAGRRVLEVGAGTGRDGEVLAGMGAKVWTLDYSENSLRLMVNHLGKSIYIVCGDATALPLVSESFDVVYHQGLLEHFRNPEVLLRENHRVLKKGGYVLVDVPQRFHYYTFVKHVLMFFDKWFAGWETEFSPRELAARLEETGFEVVTMYGHNLYPPVWYRGFRKILLKSGIRLPMYPLSSPFFERTRRALRKALPHKFILNTSMVIGCIGRKN